MKALAKMDYTAIALSESDLTYDDNYLVQQKEVATFPFLARSDTQKEFTQPFVTQKAGQYAITFVVGEVSQQAVSEADIVVALGNPKKLENIDVVILPDEVESLASDTKTVYVGSKSEGLGVLGSLVG